MTNQEEILNITTDTFVPAEAAAGGTILTSGSTYGITTANALSVGDYITDGGIARKVISVSRDGLTGSVEEAFPADLAALTTLVKISKEDAKIISLGIAADQGSDVTVGSSQITSGSSVNFSTSSENATRGTSFVRPVFIEGTAGACTATIQRFAN